MSGDPQMGPRLNVSSKMVKYPKLVSENDSSLNHKNHKF